jgi:hypothetical protein
VLPLPCAAQLRAVGARQQQELTAFAAVAPARRQHKEQHQHSSRAGQGAHHPLPACGGWRRRCCRLTACACPMACRDWRGPDGPGLPLPHCGRAVLLRSRTTSHGKCEGAEAQHLRGHTPAAAAAARLRSPAAAAAAAADCCPGPSSSTCHLMQILFLTGVGLTIGPQAALRFFVRPKNYKGSAFFLGGVLLVVWGWTFVGARRGQALLLNGLSLNLTWQRQRAGPAALGAVGTASDALSLPLHTPDVHNNLSGLPPPACLPVCRVWAGDVGLLAALQRLLPHSSLLPAVRSPPSRPRACLSSSCGSSGCTLRRLLLPPLRACHRPPRLALSDACCRPCLVCSAAVNAVLQAHAFPEAGA